MNDERAGQGRRRAAAAGVLRRQRARWRWSSTRSSTSSRTGSTSRSPATIAGVLGSAIIKGQATEIIDVGHFLPLAFEDWFRRKEQPRARQAPRSVLLVDDSPFFRNMLTPVLQAAGYAGDRGRLGARGAGAAQGRPRASTSSSPISKCRRWTASSSPRRCAPIRAPPQLPVIALSSVVSAEAIERGRQVGFHDYVAKFDRQGLIAALKEQTDVGRAA